MDFEDTSQIQPMVNNDNNAEAVNVNQSNVQEKSNSKEQPEDISINDDDDLKCIICFEYWGSEGPHRIVFLKCGHVFGLSCIERWVKSNPSCPTCKLTVQKGDILPLFVEKLLADTGPEIDRLESEKRRHTAELAEIQEENRKTKQAYAELEEESRKQALVLQKMKEQCQFRGDQPSGPPTKPKVLSMYKHQSIEVNRNGGCRVVTFKENSNLLVVTVPTGPDLFRNNYGLKKIDVLTNCFVGTLKIHKKFVQDAKFHPQQSWVLSASLDHTVKITDVSGSCVGSFDTGAPVWSCCWDSNDPNLCYAGRVDGIVLNLDVRNLGQPLRKTCFPGDSSPAVSVSSIPPSAVTPRGGLLVCKLHSAWVNVQGEHAYTQHPLPLTGPFMSGSYHVPSEHFLVSAASNDARTHGQHSLCTLSRDEESSDLRCNVVQSYFGSSTFKKPFARSCLFSYKDTYIASCLESFQRITLWSVSSCDEEFSIFMHDPVVDICFVQSASDGFLACLSETKLQLYKLRND